MPTKPHTIRIRCGSREEALAFFDKARRLGLLDRGAGLRPIEYEDILPIGEERTLLVATKLPGKGMEEWLVKPR